MKMYCAVLFVCLVAAAQANYKDPKTAYGRTAMVHLFEWNWKSIAKECEDFLGPHGFGGVQISPPHEHRILYEPDWDPSVRRPWYESYQPISYKLESRRGNRAEFIDMVQSCNDVGVRIYVDAVVNHMCGGDAGSDVGSGNSPFNTANYDFSGVPYSESNFNVPQGYDQCPTGGNINTYNDEKIVRNCNLEGLLDLDASQDYVKQKIVGYFNDVIDIGVAGFRLDAAKHMWPLDLQAIFDMTNDLNTAYFPSNTRPFFYQEVIDQDTGEAVRAEQYSGIARVTDFIYGREVSETFKGYKSLSGLESFGQNWGVKLSDPDGLVFIDNHDNQRGHGGGGNVLMHENKADYTLAVAFMLSWPHGFPRIMSSYSFDLHWNGPPTHGNPANGKDDDWSIKDPTFNADGSCADGWICEHRWRAIKNMVEWRNQAGNEPVQNFWGDYSRAAYSRGNRAFIAISRGGASIYERLQTGLPSGEYCNLAMVDYNSDAQSCTGSNTVIVGSDGMADINVSGQGDDSLLIIHVGATKDGPIVAPTSDPSNPTQAPTQGPQPTAPAGWERTVIFILKPTSSGQDLFVRGGIDHNRRGDCSNNADSSNSCAMPITHNIGGSNSKFNDWKSGDDFLDWYGAESDQGSHNGQSAEGTPLVWTTNQAGYGSNVDTDGFGYTPLNQWGEHYWMLDVNMDCSKTEEGWFEVKGLLNGNNWESDRYQGSCGGSAGGSAPYSTGNHFARCGYLNLFTFDSDVCQIDNL